MDMNIFLYCNLFPSDVPEAGSFLLALLSLTPPMERKAVLRVLKLVICDDNAAALLRSLSMGGYLITRETGQGSFFTPTAKALACLDYAHEQAHHRAQAITDGALLTYRIKGEVIARAVVKAGAGAFVEAWEELPRQEQDRYLQEKKVVQGVFEEALAALDTSTIDLLPRSIVSKRAVVHAVRDSIGRGLIPFTPCHASALYGTDAPMLRAMHSYEVAQRYKRSTRLVPGAPSPAELDGCIAALAPSCSILTYGHGQIPLTLRGLDANGIFIEAVGADTLRLGILNNAPYGLPVETLSRRLDICVSLADHMGLDPAITLYTLDSDLEITQRRLAILKEKTPFQLPDIKFSRIFLQRPLLKSETFKVINEHFFH